MTHLYESLLPSTGETLTISQIPQITKKIRQYLERGSQETEQSLKEKLLQELGIGERFTGKALRLLSGSLPFSGSSDPIDSTRKEILDLVDLRRDNPDKSILWSAIIKTRYNYEDLTRLFHLLSPQALITINNSFYDMISSDSQLKEKGEDFRHLLQCLETQLSHKELPPGYTIEEEGESKTFYGAYTSHNNNQSTPSMRKVSKKTLKRNPD